MSRFAHVASVVAGVVSTAARDAGRARLAILGGTPEADLVERLLREGGVTLPIERADAAPSDALPLDPVNKTVAVLWPELLAAPLLPLADLYASQLASLGAEWSAPPAALALIERGGGIEAVDAFLTRHLEQRRPLDEALAAIGDPQAARALGDRYRAGWWWRRRVGVVPKLGARTLGIDLR